MKKISYILVVLLAVMFGCVSTSKDIRNEDPRLSKKISFVLYNNTDQKMHVHVSWMNSGRKKVYPKKMVPGVPLKEILSKERPVVDAELAPGEVFSCTKWDRNEIKTLRNEPFMLLKAAWRSYADLTTSHGYTFKLIYKPNTKFADIVTNGVIMKPDGFELMLGN